MNRLEIASDKTFTAADTIALNITRQAQRVVVLVGQVEVDTTIM